MKSAELLARLQTLANPVDAAHAQRFFKTGPGEYGEGDRFLGIRVPAVRALVRETRREVDQAAAVGLLQSEWHEARLFGLLLMVERFRRGDEPARRALYDAYLAHTDRINNWDLVDCSAEHIIGGWLFERDRKPLYRLVKSASLWERRIAVLATFHFIRKSDFADTVNLCELLLRDEHDLMHKATGWMLREAGKRDVAVLRTFLTRHAAVMPRTMLRYAIEKLPEAERKKWMAK